MKKVALVLLVLAFAVNAHAADVLTTTLVLDKWGYKIYKLAWTDDTGEADYSEQTSLSFAGFVTHVVTDPGATAPTDNYDIDILDAYSVDIMGAELDNRDTANTEQAMPKVGSTWAPRLVAGKLTLSISGNTQDEAVGDVYIYVME